MAGPRSQNGYAANNVAHTAVYTVPGTKTQLRLRRGACAEALLIVAERFDNNVEDIDTAHSFLADSAPSAPGGEPSTLRDDWSYAPRPVRGQSTVLSNHASGTAIDLNATQHPRGVKNTFTATQRARTNAILDDLRDPATGRRVIRWGEDYRTSPVDGMHFEIDADEPAVVRAVRAYRAKQDAARKAQEDKVTPADRKAIIDGVADEMMKRMASSRSVPNQSLHPGDPVAANFTQSGALSNIELNQDQENERTAKDRELDAVTRKQVAEIHAAVVKP